MFAVNPMYDEVEGDKCYKDLASLPKLPDVVNMVVSPKRATPILEQAKKLGIKYIWFQPGTHDEKTQKYQIYYQTCFKCLATHYPIT